MDKKIDPGLFARLMQMSAPARKDLLEYIGQGPMAVPPLGEAERDTADMRNETAPATQRDG